MTTSKSSGRGNAIVNIFANIPPISMSITCCYLPQSRPIATRLQQRRLWRTVIVHSFKDRTVLIGLHIMSLVISDTHGNHFCLLAV